ncbi:hypothetical protein QBC42DRAFT_262407 [Cladorrhinum samala]|uniref:EKC/KEOPS complex subunit GON7 n=1 Tax=Cladorrhinum samala TaxID=585594 RepID=A0AAV9HXP1_9PEZI|nr:hypothetical protein QBC42DRAFT_262407 [Cladorrhinum samala]
MATSSSASDSGSSKAPPAQDSTAAAASGTSVGDHLAQALKDLARGEQTATALETNLSSLESKLDELLASFGVLADDEESKQPARDEDLNDDGDEKSAPNGKGNVEPKNSEP